MQNEALTAAFIADRADYEVQLKALEKNDAEFQRLLKAWKNKGEDGTYSSPEFIAMDARRDVLLAQIK